LRAAVEEARPFLAFRLDRVLSAESSGTPEGRARAAEGALAVIREHPNELVRDQYVMQVAERCRIDADRLRAALARPGALRPEPPVRRAPADASARSGPEVEALKAAIHRPDAVAGRLHEVLFTDDLHAAAFRAIAASASVHDAVAAADPEAAALLQRLAVEEFDADPDDVVALVVRLAAERVVDELRVAGDPQALIGWLRPHVEELLVEDTRLDAVDILLPWLVDRLKVEG
jgi:DNA primase